MVLNLLERERHDCRAMAVPSRCLVVRWIIWNRCQRQAAIQKPVALARCWIPVILVEQSEKVLLQAGLLQLELQRAAFAETKQAQAFRLTESANSWPDHRRQKTKSPQRVQRQTHPSKIL
jgi:hypothetical protein